MSFNKDVKEIFSLNKIFAFLIAFGVIIATTENKWNAGVSFSLVIIIGLIIFFILKWVFVYRKERRTKKHDLESFRYRSVL